MSQTEHEASRPQVGESQSFDAWFKRDCPVAGINAKLAARAAWMARAALKACHAQRPVTPPSAAELMALSKECDAMPGGLGMHYLNYAHAVLERWGSTTPQPPGETRADEDVRELAAIGRALNRAAIDLPKWASVQIVLERGAGTAYWLDNARGAWRHIEGSGELFSVQINAAIDAAIAARGKRK